jgi:alkanesulfonate monooxygenase SsuD/methylene tetrahydromethanopterin reductase-like flavin-dependent oxidoreductase (luciferase family)
MCYVVMDETDAKAHETVEWMKGQIDDGALRNWLRRSGHVLNSQAKSLDDSAIGNERGNELDQDPYLGIGQQQYESLGMGMGAYQLFGSYETVADQLVELYEAGIEQVALCFFDPHKGVQQMREHVVPLLRERGFNHDLV